MFDTILDSVADAVVSLGNTVSGGYAHTVHQGAKQWNAYTGKTVFCEAEKLREQIETKYTEAHENYSQVVEEVIPQIKHKLNEINNHKKDIFDIHFNNFTGLANRLHNLTIQGESFIEYFDENLLEIRTVTGLRSKAELYKIDFNNLSLKDIFFGWLTLGFISRKQAKKTLDAVKEEEKRIDEDIAKMEVQSKKLKVVLESLINIESYFQVLISSYSKLLMHFEYGIQSQTQRQLLSRIPLQGGKINFRLMPLIHIEEFQALFNLSIVLKTMSKMGYLNDNIEIKERDFEAFTNMQNLVSTTLHDYIVVAA